MNLPRPGESAANVDGGGGVAAAALGPDLVATLRSFGVIPVVEVEDAGRAAELGRALVAGGLPVVEVTFRTEAAAAALESIAAEVPEVFLIAGTVTTVRQAEIAREAGVRMLVAPGLNPAIVEEAMRLGLPMMPGVCTPSEVEAALSLGLRAVKVFPIEPIGGVRYLRALAAPYTTMAWNPTGGITPETLPEYLAIRNVLACGGSWVAPRADIAAGKFGAIAERAAAAVKVVGEARPSEVMK